MKVAATTQPHEPQAWMFGDEGSALRRSYAAKKLATAADVLPIQYEKTHALLPSGSRFNGRMLDGEPQLLQQIFKLRYQVYCLQRGFLPAERYPTGIEIIQHCVLAAVGREVPIHVPPDRPGGRLLRARRPMPVGLASSIAS